VIFTSDHGDSLGDHGHIQKWTMYDEIVRVPLVVWSPGRVQAGQVRDELCQLMDVGRTVLDLAGVAAPPSMQADSLLPGLEGESWAGREQVFAEHVPDGIYEGPYMTMIREAGWKLVHFVDTDDGQLFDLRADPAESYNLWYDLQHSATRQRLLLALLNWRVRSTEQTADVFSHNR
jgi:arylsulfatase A-like enzyme